MPGTVPGAEDLRVNKADGVPVLLELVPLEGKAEKQANGVRRGFKSVTMRLTGDREGLGRGGPNC